MRTASTLTAERLRELLLYDPTAGLFHWRVKRGRGVQAGTLAGTFRKDGYRLIRVDGNYHLAHRLAWLYVHGSWPARDLDHRNEDPGDNRLSNLREDVDGLNQQNRSRPQRNSRSGFLGVDEHQGRWRSSIRADGRNRFLGYFDTPEEAAEAYLAAKSVLHPFWDGGAQ